MDFGSFDMGFQNLDPDTFGGILAILLQMIPFVMDLVIIAIEMVVFAVIYFFTAFPLYKMAKTAGHPNAWLAWIPIFNYYLSITLPEGDFVLFENFMRMKRKKAAWIAIASTLVPFVMIAFSIVLGVFTFGIGLLFFFPIMLLVLIFNNLILYAMFWRSHYDLYLTFNPGEEKKTTNLTISIIGIFVQILHPVFMMVIHKNPPVYGAGRYSETHRE